MSSNLGSSSKRKREKRSVPQPEELRRSARQKGKNKLPVIQRAMNIKKANNSLESDSSKSTQNHNRANEQTNVVRPTPAAIGQHINQTGSHNFNSDDGRTTAGRIHNVNEERASRLNPLAPEFHFDLSNNKPMQSYIQSSRSQQPIMTDPSQRVIHPIMPDTSNRTTEAPHQRSSATIDLNMQASSFHRISSQHGNLINEAPQPACSAPIDQNVQASSYYRNLSSRSDSSRRVDHPIIDGSCNHTNEAPQPSSSVPTIQNTQASLCQKFRRDMLLDAPRRLNPSQGAGFHRSVNQAARPTQFAPSFAALNSQMMSSDASQRVNQLIMAESCNLSNEAPRPSSNTAINQNTQAVPFHQISSPRHGSFQRVRHPIMADSCNLNEAPQPSSNYPIDLSMQTSLLYQMLSSQHGVPQQRQSSSYPIVDPTPNDIAVNQKYPIVGANSSQRNNYPVLDFITHEFNTGNRQCHMNFPRLDNSATSNSQMNDSLSGDHSFALINSLKGADLHISENDSSNNGRRSFTSILNSAYDAKTQLQLEAEFRRSVVIQDQPQSRTEPNNLMTTNSIDSRKWQNDAKRMKRAHKEEQGSIPPVITNHIRTEGGNPLSQSPPQPKPLGERCQLCKIDLAFMARGENARSSSDLPFAAVLPCKHAFHDRCLKDFFGDVEPPCVECLDAQVSRGC